MTLAITRPRNPRAREVPRFEALVRSQSPRLWPIARALVCDSDAAGRVLRESFASLEPIFSGMRSAQLADWLRRRVILTALDVLHERCAAGERPIDALLPRFGGTGRHATNAVVSPSGGGAVRRLRYREGLERLPRAYRDVVLLRDALRLDCGETSELLNMGPALVRYRLHHARLALCASLAAEVSP